MNTENLVVDINDRIATVTLNRPKKKNAINTALYKNICETLERLGESAEIDVVVLKGKGDCFSVGEDLQELANDETGAALAEWRRTYRSFVRVTWHLPKMVLAEIRGETFGVGCELALLADVTYADPTAMLGHPEMAHGLLSPTVWPWLAGPKVAKEYLSSARIMDAAEAKRVRLINQVFPEDTLAGEVDALARDFASMPPGAAVANKRRLNWSHRDISRTLLDDLFYGLDFQWQVENRAVDEAFYHSVRDQGFDGAIKKRNARFVKS